MNTSTRTALLIMLSRMEKELHALRAMVEMAEAEEQEEAEEKELSSEELAAVLFKPRDYACYERMGW